MAVQCLLGPQNRRQRLQRLPGVNHTGGIVGRVDDHALCPAVHSLFKGSKVDLELLDLRRDHLHLAPGSLNKYLVFRKIGCKEDVFIAGTGQAVEHAAQGGCRAYRQIQLVRRIVLTEAAVQGIGNALPGTGITGGAGVAVNRVCLFPQQPDGGLIHLYGSGDAGVSQ